MTIVNDKYEKALEPFLYLWRVDDKEWLAERKKQWEAMEPKFQESTKKHQKVLKQYFINGKKTEYISPNLLYLLTPYDSPDSAREVFYSDLFSHHEAKRRVLSEYVLSAAQWAEGMPWLREHIQWFVEGVLENKYKVIKQHSGQTSKTISPEPTFWCRSYIHAANKLLQGKML